MDGNMYFMLTLSILFGCLVAFVISLCVICCMCRKKSTNRSRRRDVTIELGDVSHDGSSRQLIVRNKKTQRFELGRRITEPFVSENGKLYDQDYATIKLSCLKEGKPFTDPEVCFFYTQYQDRIVLCRY